MSVKTLATSKATESEVIAFSNLLPTEADFISKCKSVVLHSTENVHIAFDEVANTSSFFLIGDVMLDISNIEFTRISALGNSTTGNLYILAIR